MAYEEKLPARPHNVIMEERTRMSVSGVEDVESFDENMITAVTTRGNLVIRGSGLHIGKLSLDTGELAITGEFTDLSYEENVRSGGLWSRLFGG